MHPGRVKADIQLPNELLWIIINELASDSGCRITREALASCRLASHVLCSLATPFLFSFLRLDGYFGSPKRARALIQLLSNLHVAASVHTLTVNVWREKNILEYSQGTLFCEIVNRLPHIRNFTLDCRLRLLETFSMPKNVFMAIQALCTSPTLTTLDLCHIASFPITFITACPNLRCLRLMMVEFDVIFFSMASIIS